MKILFAIPHYFDPQGGAGYRSLIGEPQPRVDALSACVMNVHHLFGPAQKTLSIARRLTLPANAALCHSVNVVICTIGERHLLSRLPVPADVYEQHGCQCEPKLLGFECQQVLRDALDRYDYYCYLEDDLVLHDPLVFLKLAWFTRQAGMECLLQPNRYETPRNTVGGKIYIDGDIRPHVTGRYRDQLSVPELRFEALGTDIVFYGALNPHAGCFFLTAAQMKHWAAQPWFGDRDAGFIGPLESAATLGILRSFRVYKPAVENAAFFEIQHYDEGYLGYAGAELPFADQ